MSETIIIVGAGAAGLMAAKELSARGKSVILLEGDNRIGGRINTIQSPLFPKPIEAGAEFIHGKLPVTLQLLKEAAIFYQPQAGKMHNVENGKWHAEQEFTAGWDEIMHKMEQLETDMTLADFLQQYFPGEKYSDLRISVQHFAEGFDLADINKASVLAIREEWADEQEEQYRIPGGYHQLMNYLAQQCKANGCVIHTSCIVKNIQWKKQEVKVVSAAGEVFTGNKVIITVPIGILQAPPMHTTAISFEPQITDYLQAADNIGFGSVIKIILQFKEPFWTAYSNNIGFVFSEQVVPTWWTQLPDDNAMLTGWLGGPQASKYDQKGDKQLLQISLQSLSTIFNKEVAELSTLLVASHISNWHHNEFSLGAYSYSTVQTEKARKLLHTPLQETIYFAGEGLYSGVASATVEAALISGRDVAISM